MLVSLNATKADCRFPNPEKAELEPNGLLAVGGDLSPQRLLNAYRSGIFPWFNADQPILWWSPDPRGLLFPDQFHCSHRLGRRLREDGWQFSYDQTFKQVIHACATVTRQGQDGTWILPVMEQAYSTLHQLGHAHAIEIWRDGELVGGLYGVALGKAFYGESMFSLTTDASKIALFALTQRLRDWGFLFLDCQMLTPHLQSLGAQAVSRARFLRHNREALLWQEERDWSLPPRPLADLLA